VRIGRDEELRRKLIARGLELAHANTIESESSRVAAFLEEAAGRR
jgi:hypothetical protein